MLVSQIVIWKNLHTKKRFSTHMLDVQQAARQSSSFLFLFHQNASIFRTKNRTTAPSIFYPLVYWTSSVFGVFRRMINTPAPNTKWFTIFLLSGFWYSSQSKTEASLWDGHLPRGSALTVACLEKVPIRVNELSTIIFFLGLLPCSVFQQLKGALMGYVKHLSDLSLSSWVSFHPTV